MIVEVHDVTGNSPISYIGSKYWSPHDGHDAPMAAYFEESTHLTAKPSKSAIWL